MTEIKLSGKSDDVTVLTLYEECVFQGKAKIMDDALEGFLSATCASDRGFEGKFGQTLLTHLPSSSKASKRVLLLGLGKSEDLTVQKIKNLGGKLCDALNSAKAKTACLQLEEDLPLSIDDVVSALSEGVLRKNYRFGHYMTKDRDQKLPTLEMLALDCEASAKVKKALETTKNLVAGIAFTRDLVSMPPNDLYPQSFAELAEKQLKPLGVKVKIFDEKKLEKMGAGAILAVGKGSSRKPRMVILEYNGLGKDSKGPEIGLVGKGITFDTGGYNIKTSNMHWMQFDMGGAGIVCGVLEALARNKVKKHVVAALALAENMISDEAYRPSDIITSLSGQTIEVLNTDAEGRLVMCDAITYIQDTYKVQKLVDVATLTGACMVALGTEYGGAFTEDEGMWQDIEAAGQNSGDKIWRLPMDEVWDKEMDGTAADMRNLGAESRFGGASAAAAFLKKFIKEDTRWAHLDVAGTVWSFTDRDLWKKGATGHAVSLLYRFCN